MSKAALSKPSPSEPSSCSIGVCRTLAAAMLLGSGFACAARADERPTLRGPFGDGVVPTLPAPFDRIPGARVFGPGGIQLTPMDPSGHPRMDAGSLPKPKPPAETPEQKAEALKKALAPKPTPAVVRQTTIDNLFKRLAAADEPDVGRVVAGAIERLWLRSDSATADLLMERAIAAIAANQLPLAQQMLDKTIELEPDWTEAWNKRATVRFLAGDLDGSMADIDQVLKREPRHFGALTGMAAILRKTGFDAQALAVFRKVLALYPAQPELAAQVEKLKTEVEGREL